MLDENADVNAFVGSVDDMVSYQSSAVEHYVVKDFTIEGSNQKTVVKIYVPDETPVVPILNRSAFPLEREFVLPSGTTLKKCGGNNNIEGCL